jgi:hypothetical protein
MSGFAYQGIPEPKSASEPPAFSALKYGSTRWGRHLQVMFGATLGLVTGSAAMMALMSLV